MLEDQLGRRAVTARFIVVLLDTIFKFFYILTCLSNKNFLPFPSAFWLRTQLEDFFVGSSGESLVPDGLSSS